MKVLRDHQLTMRDKVNCNDSAATGSARAEKGKMAPTRRCSLNECCK